MKGFTRIQHPGLLQAGDVLLAPPEARALHVSPATLSKHGLSNGDTCRSHNSYRTVAQWFTETKDTGLAMMVSGVTQGMIDTGRRILNTLREREPETKLLSFTAHRLDDRLIPTSTVPYSERTYVMGTVEPLVTAVLAEFDAICADRTLFAAYEEFPRIGAGARSGWSAMRCALQLPFIKNSMFRLTPAAWLDARRKPEDHENTGRITCRLFGAATPYELNLMSRDNTLTVRDSRTISHFFANGMEIYRPEPETWKALAKEVLARHAQLALADIAEARESLNEFTKQMKADVEGFLALEAGWTSAAKELAGRTAIASPYRKVKEAQ